MSLEAADHEVYLLLKQAIKVSVADAEDSTPHPGKSGHLIRTSSTFSASDGEKGRSGGQKAEPLRLIDWENPANNDFLLAASSASPALFPRLHPSSFIRASGLVVIELKKPCVPCLDESSRLSVE